MTLSQQPTSQRSLFQMQADKMNLDYWKSQLDELWLENMRMIHKGKNIDEAIEQSFGYLISDELRLHNSDTSDFKRLVNGWLSNKRPEQKKVGQRIDLRNI